MMTEYDRMNAQVFLEDVLTEYETSCVKHGKFNSAHEGYAVILEELDELWDEVRKKRSNRDHKNMRRECEQIAAMALKFVLSCCKKESK